MKKFLLIALVVMFLPSLLWGATSADINVHTTLAELRQDVNNLFLVMTDDLFPDSVKDDFINLACRDIAGYNVIVDVDTVVWVANTRYYALPVNFRDFIAIYPDTAATGKAFSFIHPSAVGKIAAATDLTVSRYVWITGPSFPKDTTSRIWFYPAPSAIDTMQLIFASEAIELVASTDTTNIPYHYRPLVGYYAMALCYAKAEKFDRSGWYFALYQQMLDRKLLFEQKRYDYILIPREIKQ